MKIVVVRYIHQQQPSQSIINKVYGNNINVIFNHYKNPFSFNPGYDVTFNMLMLMMLSGSPLINFVADLQSEAGN